MKKIKPLNMLKVNEIMFNYYSVDIIPIILKIFKVDDIIISSFSKEDYFDQIVQYCENDNASIITIDSNDAINNYPLKELSQLSNYGAIFLNDDPNWYTVYTELNLIKQNNDVFPLVFICHNIFPHKRRDSYIRPNIIPNEFINEYSDDLFYNNIHILDNYFHALDENTPKNGVLTAIEDFLSENYAIGIMDINFLNGITVLYPKNSISHIRVGKLFEEIVDYEIDYNQVSDNIVENQMLTEYISRFDISSDEKVLLSNYQNEIQESNNLIKEYDEKLKRDEAELRYKDSLIKNYGAEMNLKDSQIEYAESKVINNEKEIDDLNNQLLLANSEINTLKSNILNFQKNEAILKTQFNSSEEKVNELNNQIQLKKEELLEKDENLNSIKHQYESQFYKLDNKNYCLHCLKEEISNNHLEINYLREDSLIKKILIPFSYIYLTFKSKPKELSLNFKLYKALKNSNCFDIGYYLNNNPDLIESRFCKYFSPELHYICNGFNEKRKFNKKYFNRNSKRELLEYILKCNKIELDNQ